ncbi:hypothetical protein E1B28_011906 [Marasmius oreades]|uniref:Uncharacterized protein n=1 Tax=Marasmius oreades TaxID=181124 RepID=A0A9P7RVP9_9AGAR|nr:uncharacterized protein E1B28_011906 [Marasmius oreades]KAG7090308.1 hypothetical protein E1B28_011906 [Marasmius oreades]
MSRKTEDKPLSDTSSALSSLPSSRSISPTLDGNKIIHKQCKAQSATATSRPSPGSKVRSKRNRKGKWQAQKEEEYQLPPPLKKKPLDSSTSTPTPLDLGSICVADNGFMVTMRIMRPKGNIRSKNWLGPTRNSSFS